MISNRIKGSRCLFEKTVYPIAQYCLLLPFESDFKIELK